MKTKTRTLITKLKILRNKGEARGISRMGMAKAYKLMRKNARAKGK